jgi:FixJ family two-component response regulator
VLLMIGQGDAEVQQRFEGTGLAGFVQKPFRPADLLAALRRALEGQPPPE